MSVILCIDLDGTVLDRRGRLPEREFARVLDELQRCKGSVHVMTARPIQDVARIFADFNAPLDVWASDGACRGTISGGVITAIGYEAALAPEVARSTVAQLLDHPNKPEALVFGTSTSEFEIVGYGESDLLRSSSFLRRMGDVRTVRRAETREEIATTAQARQVRAVQCLGMTAEIRAHD